MKKCDTSRDNIPAKAKDKYTGSEIEKLSKGRKMKKPKKKEK